MDADRRPKLVVEVAKELAKEASLDPVSARALVDTVAHETSKEKFLLFIQKYPDVTFKFIGECVKRLEQAYATINGLGVNSLEQQVAVILLKLAETIGKKEESKIILDFSLSHRDLAEMAGRTQKSISRFIASLKKEGIVGCTSTKIIIYDMGRLKLMAEKKRERSNPSLPK